MKELILSFIGLGILVGTSSAAESYEDHHDHDWYRHHRHHDHRHGHWEYHHDRRLPIHGVKWALLAWDVIATTRDRLMARLEWTRPELLAVFPFRHKVAGLILCLAS